MLLLHCYRTQKPCEAVSTQETQLATDSNMFMTGPESKAEEGGVAPRHRAERERRLEFIRTGSVTHKNHDKQSSNNADHGHLQPCLRAVFTSNVQLHEVRRTIDILQELPCQAP